MWAAEQPDLTLDEIVAAMRKRRIPGSRAVWRFFARHDLTFKKKRACAPQSNNGWTRRTSPLAARAVSV
jgi:hypothetical protein